MNDVIFAVHAVVLTLITLAQIAIYDRGSYKVSRLAKYSSSLVWASIIVYAIVTATSSGRNGGGFFSWYTFAYYLSYIKLVITFVKYIPQVLLNYRRKSTLGWNVWNVLLDFTGGFLSVVQLLMDSGIDGEPLFVSESDSVLSALDALQRSDSANGQTSTWCRVLWCRRADAGASLVCAPALSLRASGLSHHDVMLRLVTP